MYIPLWIIIFGAIVFYFYSSKKEKSEEDLEPDISKRKIKLVDPNSLDLVKIDRLLKKHEDKILSLKEDISKIKEERENFNDELGLGYKMWRFIDEVRHYHAWYENSKKTDKKPNWISKAMNEKDFVLKKFSSFGLKNLIKNSNDFRETDDVVEYSFQINENKYIVLINKINYSDHGDTSGYISHHSVLIFENSNRIVYQAKIYQDSNEAGYSYDHNELEAFKPGLWVKFLLGKIFDIHKEYEQFIKELSEENEKFFNKLDKEKFVD